MLLILIVAAASEEGLSRDAVIYSDTIWYTQKRRGGKWESPECQHQNQGFHHLWKSLTSPSNGVAGSKKSRFGKPGGWITIANPKQEATQSEMWMVLSCVIWPLVLRLESNLGQSVSRVAVATLHATLHIANLRSRSHSAALSGLIEHEIAQEVWILSEPKWLQARYGEASVYSIQFSFVNVSRPFRCSCHLLSHPATKRSRCKACKREHGDQS